MHSILYFFEINLLRQTLDRSYMQLSKLQLSHLTVENEFNIQ